MLRRSAGFVRNRTRAEGVLYGYDGSSSQWKRRKFVLNGDDLSYRQEEAVGEGSFGAENFIPLFSSATLEVRHLRA
jgi:hypothetical protein